jgi:tetratricopeptide (TPR) repeat protein
VSNVRQVREERLTSALSLHLRGILHAHEGRYEEAEAAFLGAVQADPEMAGSYVELGMVYACRKQYSMMVEALWQAVGISPSAVRAYLGERPLGDIAPEPATDARRSASGAVAGEGEDALSLIALAMSHLAAGRDDRAAGVLEPMLERQPGCPPEAVALLALSCLLRGESVEVTGEGIRRGMAPADARGTRS